MIVGTPVQTKVKVVLSVVTALVIALIALAGTGAFIVFRNLSVTRPTSSDAAVQIDALRRRFPARPPLIDIDDPLRGRVHVNHPPLSAPLKHLQEFEILAWQADEGKLVHTRAPIWMMRFSTLSLLSEFGLAPRSMRLTVDDVERYGPGVVLDFTSPRGDRALVVAR
jgi:hypothetical protein